MNGNRRQTQAVLRFSPIGLQAISPTTRHLRPFLGHINIHASSIHLVLTVLNTSIIPSQHQQQDLHSSQTIQHAACSEHWITTTLKVLWTNLAVGQYLSLNDNMINVHSVIFAVFLPEFGEEESKYMPLSDTPRLAILIENFGFQSLKSAHVIGQRYQDSVTTVTLETLDEDQSREFFLVNLLECIMRVWT
ncbi:hypothetical protein M422DRAFT_259874 [Sphaerobolus stellatus SS14]|uniref:Uncharacterized protein n=1 Tax=Sphaerobolus stellatus (strain SS14) TaxID=990650 RepID=A0A0C9VIX3_SPHS4|nr:hypothetical protein M422DRAFT_259874 [Sphaerobolus stellatus SS14]